MRSPAMHATVAGSSPAAIQREIEVCRRSCVPSGGVPSGLSPRSCDRGNLREIQREGPRILR